MIYISRVAEMPFAGLKVQKSIFTDYIDSCVCQTGNSKTFSSKGARNWRAQTLQQITNNKVTQTNKQNQT